MPRETKIKYDPSLSVAENAKKCGVSVAAIRYYIKTRGIDRRYEGKVKVVEGMKAYLAEHPNATRAELQRATGHGINTIRRYWEVLHGTEELPTNQNKSTIREREKVVSHKRHITYLNKLPIEFLREYMQAREAAANAEIEATPEVVEVAEQPPKKARAKTKKPQAPRANSTIRCTDEFVYFYQNTPLSNWWASNPRIPYDGHDFASSEALYMYLKARGLGDDKVANEILALDDNAKLTDRQRFAKAKSLGKKCKFNNYVFLANREKWMYTALSAKYEVDEEFRRVLMSDEYRGLTFVEASPRDVNWGIGLSVSAAYEGKAWKGKNLLGKLLTKLRDEHLGTNTTQ
ncbi:MAG: DUF1768 domain-containing protein [Alistipes sp.]|nr:DUF1768 domain-containing protein [Alistipes sp.]